MDTEVDVLQVHVVRITLSDVYSLVPAYADFHQLNVFPERIVFSEPYRGFLIPKVKYLHFSFHRAASLFCYQGRQWVAVLNIYTDSLIILHFLQRSFHSSVSL